MTTSKIVTLHGPCPSSTCSSSDAYCEYEDGHGYALYRRAYNLLYAARHRAKKKKQPFDLDLTWILERLKGRCEATDLPFELNQQSNNFKGRHICTPSIDKIDPDKGYVKNNCRLVIWWFNAAKGTETDLTLWHLCARVVELLAEKDVLNVKKKDGIFLKTT